MTFASSLTNMYLSTDGGITWKLVRPSGHKGTERMCVCVGGCVGVGVQARLTHQASKQVNNAVLILASQAAESPHEYRILDHGGILLATPYFKLTDSILCVFVVCAVRI